MDGCIRPVFALLVTVLLGACGNSGLTGSGGPVLQADIPGGSPDVEVMAINDGRAAARTSHAVTAAGASGDVPQIVNPAEELQGFAPTGILRWSAVAGADAYEIWAYKDPGLTQLAEFSKALVSRQYQFTQLAGEQTYYIKLYYRVPGAWRELPTFLLRTTSKVVKARLTNSQEELDSLGTDATLRWTAVQGADRYELWVYRDAALVAFAETSGPVQITQYQVKNLSPGSTYHVQVYSRVSGVYHAGGALQVTVVGTTTRARIVNSQEELDGFATRGILRWSAVTGASAYEVWIFANPNSSEIFESSGSLTGRQYAARTLQPGTTYYAQVFAQVNGSWQVGAPVKITTVATPTRARLTTAQDEIDNFSTSGTLRWTEVTGAVAYEVWIYGNAGLGSVIESGANPDRSYQVKKLCNGAAYYVQVYALVNGVWTSGWATRLNVTQGESPPGCTPPAPTVRLTALPLEAISGEHITLTWTTKFATSCAASDSWSGPRPVSGQESTGPINGNSLFTLVCSNQGGSTLAQLLVTVAPPLSSLAGDISLPSATRVDGDVNDPNATYRPNNSLATAQSLPNPVVLGGYVNDPFRGEPGRLFQSGDWNDTYRMTLSAGQVIELLMLSADPMLPDSLRDDADLELYSQAGFLVDESIGVGQVERLSVPASGTYYIRVVIWSGAPLYRLSVGSSTGRTVAATVSDTVRLSDEFVPGELVVTLHGGTAAGARQKAAAAIEKSLALSRKAGDPSREMLMAVPAHAAQVPGASKPSLGGGGDAELRVPEHLRAKVETLRYLKMLRNDPNVHTADVNRIMRASAVPNDPLYAVQRWHYELIGLPSAWSVVAGNASVTAAVIDTGVVRHPDLVANLVAGYDFVRGPNEDGDGIDSNSDDPGCSLEGSSVYHGTHVAGTISAATNNANGVAGVAGNVRVMPLRVLDGCGSGNSYDIRQGIRFAAGLANDSGTLPARHADVINLSLGAAAPCDSLTAELFAQVRAQGVIVVAAAGNENTSSPGQPASCPYVISVSSVGPLREKASYSNYGATWVDVAAPGGEMNLDSNGDGYYDGVLSTGASGFGSARYFTYRLLQGTSMAAPHVAGVASLMKSARSSLTPAEFDLLLLQGRLTDDIGPPGADDLGVGLINAYKAVQAVTASAPPLPPTLAVTPSIIDLGDIGTRVEVVLANSGGGSLTVNGVTPSSSRIGVSAVAVDSSGLGRYSVTVNRAGLAAGSYSGTVDFASTAGVVRVSVYVKVAEAASQPDAGYGYVLLIDPGTGETVDWLEGPASGLSMPYEFLSVPSGEYFVISGTDLDNDQYVCDEGEACGAYPVVSQPVPVRVVGSVVGIDFSTGFDVDVGAGTQTSGERSPTIEARRRGFARRH